MSGRTRLLALALGLAPLCAGCPSESTEYSQEPVAPAGGVEVEPTVLDEVEVQGADEAAEAADSAIDEENVLDALDSLEDEIDGDS